MISAVIVSLDTQAKTAPSVRKFTFTIAFSKPSQLFLFLSCFLAFGYLVVVVVVVVVFFL